jgi:hypothetical protein
MRILPTAVVLAFAFGSIPAFAQVGDSCVAPATQIEQIAAGKSGDKDTAKALRLTQTAKLLCAAGNEREAQKKFRLAFKTLGVDASGTQLVQR